MFELFVYAVLIWTALRIGIPAVLWTLDKLFYPIRYMLHGKDGA